ncbi:MAG: hypothetical protein SFX73_00350 [Kofleriaceae bacterium]|nr:hypothetical protein [Kofleriaceae bacterium]
MVFRRAVLSVFFLAACGDDSGPAFDAPIDTVVPVDIDNGACGAQVRFTGEYIDWDSDASFCGINAAVVAVSGGAMDATAPNGRFDLCIPDAATTRLEVTQPTANSQCTVPASMYTTPTILVANRDVIFAGAMFSGRSFTADRRTSFFTDVVGAPFDATKAQVFAHVAGAPRMVTLAATHGPAQAVTGTAWAAGSTGTDVFFPNVDVGDGSTTLSAAGGAIGTGSIPLVAGTITNVTLFAQ